MTSGNDDKAALGPQDANALPTFVLISKAVPGLFKTFYAVFFDTLRPF